MANVQFIWHYYILYIVTFTIFYAEEAGGDYQPHTAQILDWPTHGYAPWDYGSVGNWNPVRTVRTGH